MYVRERQSKTGTVVRPMVKLRFVLAKCLKNQLITYSTNVLKISSMVIE